MIPLVNEQQPRTKNISLHSIALRLLDKRDTMMRFRVINLQTNTKHYVLIEQSGVQDSTKFVGKEIDELDEEISNFGEVLGYDFVRKTHDDVSAYRESRLAALGTWQRGINEIVDESVAGRELVPASVIRQTYDSVGEKMDRANKLEETVIQNSSDLYALITKKLLAAGAVAGR